MAATLTLTAATPHSLKYEYNQDGMAGTIARRTKAQMLADLVNAAETPSAGPLRALLEHTVAAADWNDLPLGPRLSLYARSRGPASGTLTTAFEQDGLFFVLAVDIPVAVAGARQFVEIRFNHSFDK